MREYDSTLKSLLQSSAKATLRALTGSEVTEWLNIELPRTQKLRVDLLGELANGELVHIVLEYGVAILRSTGRYPRQMVLYVGNDRLTMTSELHGPGLDFRYQLFDMRELDGEGLLASPQVSDNVMGTLGRIADWDRA